MKNIIKGRVYFERKELITFPKEIVVKTLGTSFLVNNFILIKKSCYTKYNNSATNGVKIDNLLYEYDIINNTDFERWKVKAEVEYAVEKYIEKNIL